MKCQNVQVYCLLFVVSNVRASRVHIDAVTHAKVKNPRDISAGDKWRYLLYDIIQYDIV